MHTAGRGFPIPFVNDPCDAQIGEEEGGSVMVGVVVEEEVVGFEVAVGDAEVVHCC